MNDFNQYPAVSENGMKGNTAKGLAEMYPHISAAEIIHLSKQAFWDTDMSKFDYTKQADYIIRKVFEHGSWNDILEVTAYYGIEEVKSVLISASYLRQNTLYFASLFLNIPQTNFKCYATKQYHPVL